MVYRFEEIIIGFFLVLAMVCLTVPLWPAAISIIKWFGGAS